MTLEDIFVNLVEVIGPHEAIRHLLAALYDEVGDHPVFYRIKRKIEREVARVPPAR